MMNLTLLPGSLRNDSFNRELLRQTQALLRAQLPNSTTHLVSLKELSIPLYDGDDEEASGLPPGVESLCQQLNNSDAVIISSPEYNGAISGVLKNTLDWVSRSESPPFQRKPVLLLSASPGALGGVRGLWHTRVPLEAMGAYVFPEMFGLPQAHRAWGEAGSWADPKNAERLSRLLGQFIQFTASLRASN